jgi:hypothetical protein
MGGLPRTGQRGQLGTPVSLIPPEELCGFRQLESYRRFAANTLHSRKQILSVILSLKRLLRMLIVISHNYPIVFAYSR